MLTPEKLHELLEYDPETGTLTWKCRGNPQWDARFAGKAAFTSYRNGYKAGGIFNKMYDAHRIIWMMVHGEWPNTIDHINGVKDDNRIENLRNVTQAENCRNAKRTRNNKSGHNGVSWSKGSRKWLAQIMVNRKCIYLGRFIDIEDAIAARAAAEIEHGFHENHGRVMP